MATFLLGDNPLTLEFLVPIVKYNTIMMISYDHKHVPGMYSLMCKLIFLLVLGCSQACARTITLAATELADSNTRLSVNDGHGQEYARSYNCNHG